MSVIVLTAGHSNTDPGAVSGGYAEADLMLELRDRVADELRDLGHIVIEDGSDGENLPLRHAISLVRQGALAVELHTNAHSDPAARGVEAISLPPLRRFSQRLSQAVADVLETRVRGDNGWIDQSRSFRGRLGYVEGGGVILETFFLSNPRERAKFIDRMPHVAEAIADAIHEEML